MAASSLRRRAPKKPACNIALFLKSISSPRFFRNAVIVISCSICKACALSLGRLGDYKCKFMFLKIKYYVVSCISLLRMKNSKTRNHDESTRYNLSERNDRLSQQLADQKVEAEPLLRKEPINDKYDIDFPGWRFGLCVSLLDIQ